MRFNFEVIYNRIKFADVFKLFRGSSPRPIERFISSDKNDPYWIKIGDMPEIGYFVNTVKEHISIEGAKKSRAVYKGDMILSNSMSFGKPYILNIDGYIHDGWFVIRHYEEYFERDYLRYLLASPSIQKRYTQIAAGGVVLNISSDLVNSVVTFIPEKHEQSKISLFLSLIDKRIDTQNKIIEDLKLLKFRLIDSLIGENIPNCIFENLYNFASEGGTPSTSKMQYYENGTIPFVKIDDLKEKYLQENRDYITEDGLSNSSAWLIPTNSIIYSNGATIGKLSINTYPIATKQGILGIIPSKLVIPEYMYYFMQSKYFRKEVHKITVKGTMDCAYLKDLSKIKCYIPSIKEQEKDIAILNCLDEKIKIEYILIKKYKEQKKFLLSNMFI